MFTVRDALNLSSFNGSRVLAGERNLDNLVTSATVLEATSSEVTKWIKGGELFITSFYAVAKDVEKQKEVLRILHSQKCAAVAVFSLGYFMDKLDVGVIELSEELGVPLIVMSPEKGYDKVLEEITMSIHSIQKEELALALHIQSEIFSLVMRKKDRSKIFDFIGEALQKKLAFYKSDDTLDYCTGETKDAPEEIYYLYVKQSGKMSSRHEGGAEFQSGHMRYALTMKSSYYGTIVVFDVNDKEREQIQMVLSNVTLAIILTLTKNSVYYPQNHIQRQEFLDRLLRKGYRSALEIYKQASALGMELHNKHYIVIVELPPNAISNALEQVKRVAEVDSLSNEVMVLHRQAFVFVNGVERSLSEKRLDALCENIAKAVDCENKPYICVSGYLNSIMEVSAAYRQALLALKVGRKFFSESASIRYDDLGIYALILNEYTHESAGRYIRNSLERLRKYDEEHSCDYMNTLRVLLMDGENFDAIADKLYVHKNTLFYRKKKIVQILGHDPLEIPHQLNYQLYFVAQELLDYVE